MERKKVSQGRDYEIVVVVWSDAEHCSGWEDEGFAGSFAKRPLALAISCGFLINKDETSLTLIQSFAPDHEKVGELHRIPIKMVKRIESVGIVRHTEVNGNAVFSKEKRQGLCPCKENNGRGGKPSRNKSKSRGSKKG